MSRNLMLFAAGRGTRMGALTEGRPKPLIKVAGRALLDYALDQSESACVDKTVLNVHHFSDMVRTHVQGRDVIISDESEMLLETGGGLRAALPLLGKEPVFTLNSDALWHGPNPLELLEEHWQPDDMDALLLLLPKEKANAHGGNGDFETDDAGRLTRGQSKIYLGAQILRTEGLHQIEEQAFSLNLLWDQYLKQGRLYGVVYPGSWVDVGTPLGLEQAETLLETPPHV